MNTVGSAIVSTPESTTFNFPHKLSQKDISNLATVYGGRYIMQFQASYNSNTQNTNFYILVWDTESGQSKLYYGSSKKGSIVEATNAFNLPSSYRFSFFKSIN